MCGNFIITQDSIWVFFFLKSVALDSIIHRTNEKIQLLRVGFFGWGIGIRTPTNRVRVCRATVTQFPNILFFAGYISPNGNDYYIHFFLICQVNLNIFSKKRNYSWKKTSGVLTYIMFGETLLHYYLLLFTLILGA